MPEGTQQQPRGGGAGATRLQLVNVLMVQITELSRQRSLLYSALQYSSDVTKADYQGFYSLFLQVYDLVSTVIKSELATEINSWQKLGVETSNNKDLRMVGLELAKKLIDELRDLGLLQVFEDSVKPPFMFDFELEEYKEQEELKRVAAATVVPDTSVAVVEQPQPPAKKKRRKK